MDTRPERLKLIHLTPRELEVLPLLAEGMENKEIGRHLGLATRTVANHLVAIYGKLGVNNRTEAAVAFMRAA